MKEKEYTTAATQSPASLSVCTRHRQKRVESLATDGAIRRARTALVCYVASSEDASVPTALPFVDVTVVTSPVGVCFLRVKQCVSCVIWSTHAHHTMLGHAIAARVGDICLKVHVLPMSLEDFKECFAEYVLAAGKARKVLPKQETAPPKASWFGPTDKDREAYTAWASKLLSCKLEGGGPGITTVGDLATEYFYKVGPDVRRLADLVGDKEVNLTFAEGMCCFVCTCFHSRSHSDQRRAR